MLDTFQTEIYLFFSNWFGYKGRESHTNKFLSASKHVFYCNLDADLQWKEKQKNFSHPDNSWHCGIQNSFMHFTIALFFE